MSENTPRTPFVTMHTPRPLHDVRLLVNRKIKLNILAFIACGVLLVTLFVLLCVYHFPVQIGGVLMFLLFLLTILLFVCISPLFSYYLEGRYTEQLSFSEGLRYYLDKIITTLERYNSVKDRHLRVVEGSRIISTIDNIMDHIDRWGANLSMDTTKRFDLFTLPLYEFFGMLKELLFRINYFVCEGKDIPQLSINHLVNFFNELEKNPSKLTDSHILSLKNAIHALKEVDSGIRERVKVSCRQKVYDTVRTVCARREVKIGILLFVISLSYWVVIPLTPLHITDDMKLTGFILLFLGLLPTLAKWIRK